MARKKAVKDDRIAAGNYTNGFKGFVTHRLTEEEKGQFMVWSESVDVDYVWLQVDELQDSDYVLSVKHDGYGGGVQASLTCKNKNSDDLGYCLTARAPESYNAVLLLLFKHFVLLKQSWLDFHESGTQVDMWG